MANQVGSPHEGIAPATRRRSIAIAVLLLAMVVMFYAATIIRFGNNPANRAGLPVNAEDVRK